MVSDLFFPFPTSVSFFTCTAKHSALLREDQVLINNDFSSPEPINTFLLIIIMGKAHPQLFWSLSSPVLSDLILTTTLNCKNYHTHSITKKLRFSKNKWQSSHS